MLLVLMTHFDRSHSTIAGQVGVTIYGLWRFVEQPWLTRGGVRSVRRERQSVTR